MIEMLTATLLLMATPRQHRLSVVEIRENERSVCPIFSNETARPLLKPAADTALSVERDNAKTKPFEEGGWTIVATMRRRDVENEFTDARNALLARLTAQNNASLTKAIEKGISTIERIDALHNGARFGLFCMVQAASHRRASNRFDTDASGATELMRNALPHLRSNSGRLSINLSSGVGVLTLPRLPLHCAYKFGTTGFSKTLAAELDYQDIALEFISHATSPVRSPVRGVEQRTHRLPLRRTTIISSSAPMRHVAV
jgi:NADP-dependent 3-hydroxy acid dehydrogenase YdfG